MCRERKRERGAALEARVSQMDAQLRQLAALRGEMASLAALNECVLSKLSTLLYNKRKPRMCAIGTELDRWRRRGALRAMVATRDECSSDDSLQTLNLADSSPACRQRAAPDSCLGLRRRRLRMYA